MRSLFEASGCCDGGDVIGAGSPVFRTTSFILLFFHYPAAILQVVISRKRGFSLIGKNVIMPTAACACDRRSWNESPCY
jgi:hypothetical protein